MITSIQSQQTLDESELLRGFELVSALLDSGVLCSRIRDESTRFGATHCKRRRPVVDVLDQTQAVKNPQGPSR